MKTCVILNPNAGTAQRAKLDRLFDRGVKCVEITGEGEGTARAREEVEAGIDRIIVAGGDGTINEVVNGIVGTGRSVTLGIFPMGTGNDLARTLAIPLEPDGALDVIEHGTLRSIDLIAARTNGETIYGVNVASGGFSGQVDENMSPEMKATWGPLAYLLGAASTLPDLQDYSTTIQFEDEEPETVVALNVIVANGRTVGGGKRVAPMANPEDGWLDVVVVRFGPVTRLAEVAARLVAGNVLDSESVLHRRAKRVAISSEPKMWFNIDGELITRDAVAFEILPHALNVLVGKDYSPVPPESP